jgi:hypothetical protein
VVAFLGSEAMRDVWFFDPDIMKQVLDEFKLTVDDLLADKRQQDRFLAEYNKRNGTPLGGPNLKQLTERVQQWKSRLETRG